MRIKKHKSEGADLRSTQQAGVDRQKADGAQDHVGSYWNGSSEMTLQSMLAPYF